MARVRNINALDLLIMALSNLFGVNTFIENKMIDTGSYLGYDTKGTFDKYHESETDKNMFESKISEFYNKMEITKEDLIKKDTFKIYFNGEFKYAGSSLLGSNLSFGNYVTIGEDGSKTQNNCFVEFNPKILSSKFHDGSKLTDDEFTTVNEDVSDSDSNSINNADTSSGTNNINSSAKQDNLLFVIAIASLYISAITFITSKKALSK